MRIVIDGRMIGWTGIGRYTRELLNHLQTLDRTNEYIVLLQGKDLDSWCPTAPNFAACKANYEPYSINEQLKLPILLYRLRPDLVHFLSFNYPLLYSGRRITTVHDLTLYSFKHVRSDDLVRKLIYELKYWAMRATMRCTLLSASLITDSDYVRNELLHRYKHARLPLKPERVRAVHIGVAPLVAEPETYPALEHTDFLLHVGNAYPNKNLSTLITAFAELLNTQPALKLMLVGQWDYYREKLLDHARKLAVLDSVFVAGFVPDTQLVWLYRHAKLFVLPSLAEGFGLPALEAMAQGTPVAAANATSLPEVCGDAAEYFNPTSPSDISRVLGALLRDPRELARLSKAGLERARQFSWDNTARATLDIYRCVLAGHSQPKGRL